MNEPSPAYREALARLKRRERYEPYPHRRGPEKLAGMRALLARLGHPERELRVVHVAGTNGKGMTAHMIARLLGAAGGPVGLYTSPHLVHLRERIAIAGRPIAPAPFAAAAHQVLDAADGLAGEHYLSYFDVLTAIGLQAFRAAGVAWAVVETGLGGLSDATNVTGKAVAVITRIGFDHMHILGATLREIAAQKLGIARPGVPTVLATQPPGLAPWMRERLRALGSPVLDAAGIELRAGADPARLRVVWRGERFETAMPVRTLTAPMGACAANALSAVEIALGAAPPAERPARVATALAAPLAGRLDLRTRVRLRDRSGDAPGIALATLVLDGGHNADALAALEIQLRRWGLAGCTLIFGMQSDKLVAGVRGPLAALLRRSVRVITLAPQTPRAPAPAALARFIAAAAPSEGVAPSLETVPTPRAALLAAAREPDRPVVVAGSLWLLGSLMAELELPESDAFADELG
ncbi:MAG: hypothetical protein HY423_02755 [Candidatus Lambdaproteobacteria bacterium]|nr:hypothetical protein [Candidatus Lambdaproteobacteria bacterium]